MFAFFFGSTGSYKGPLASTPPASSLISLAPILSILLHILVIITFQTTTFFYVQDQSWFVPYNTSLQDETQGCYENYAVYSVSQFQYIILAVVFSQGPPYRQRIYTNHYLTATLVIMTAFSVWLVLWPTQWLTEKLELVLPPDENMFFRLQLLMFALLNSALAVFIEIFVIDYVVHKKLKKICSNSSRTKKKYLAIEKALSKEKSWPLEGSQPPQQELSVRKLQKTSGSHTISITEYHSSL